MALAHQIDEFLAQIMQVAENKHEILLGECESELNLTSTQEHILMLLMNADTTNAKMADQLKISPAAVTKALKKLQDLKLVDSKRLATDERVVMWSLTAEGLPIAKEHAEHHGKTLEAYEQLAAQFSSEEQAVISKFITALLGEFKS